MLILLANNFQQVQGGHTQGLGGARSGWLEHPGWGVGAEGGGRGGGAGMWELLLLRLGSHEGVGPRKRGHPL